MIRMSVFAAVLSSLAAPALGQSGERWSHRLADGEPAMARVTSGAASFAYSCHRNTEATVERILFASGVGLGEQGPTDLSAVLTIAGAGPQAILQVPMRRAASGRELTFTLTGASAEQQMMDRLMSGLTLTVEVRSAGEATDAVAQRFSLAGSADAIRAAREGCASADAAIPDTAVAALSGDVDRLNGLLGRWGEGCAVEYVLQERVLVRETFHYGRLRSRTRFVHVEALADGLRLTNEHGGTEIVRWLDQDSMRVEAASRNGATIVDSGRMAASDLRMEPLTRCPAS